MAATTADPAQDRNAAGNPLDESQVPHPMSKRWIPYKHSNGIAIYYHQNVTEGHDYIGGEYMVSSIVRGTPEQCLAALTHRSSTTTILGPASDVQVLSREGGSQVLHLQLVPPLGGSFSSSLAAPRHAVVQQVTKKDPCGIHCLMFNSLPGQQAQQLLQQQQQRQQQQHRHHHHHCHHHQQQQQQRWIAAVVQCCTVLDAWLASAKSLLLGLAHGSSRSSGTSSSSRWGLGGRLWRPVLVNVAGGYTISGLEGFGDDDSPESLVTCILKVDLGGWLSEAARSGWLYRPALGLGVVDTLVERLLTAVLLIKDEVEQQRFRSYPFALLEESVSDALEASSTQHHSAAGAAAHVHRSSSSGMAQHHVGLPEAAGAVQQCSSSCAGCQAQCQPGTLLHLVQGLLQNLSGWGFAAGFLQYPSHPRAAALSPQPSAGVLGFEAAAPQGSSRADSTSKAAGFSEGFALGSRSASVSGFSSEAASGFGVGARGSIEQLVGRDEQGQPLIGSCNPSFWLELHQPGRPAPFKVRGPQYLSDRAKVSGGPPAYTLLAVDLVTTPTAVHHIARYLPSVRRSRAASCFVVNMMVPAADNVLNLVMTFGSDRRFDDLVKQQPQQQQQQQQQQQKQTPQASSSSSAKYSSSANFRYGSSNGAVHSSSGSGNKAGRISSSNGAMNGADSGSSSSSGSEDCPWSGFDHVLYRFLTSSDAERSSIFKMIPHIEVGSWLLKQTVGTTPVIMGRKLATSYHVTYKYVEVDIDVTTCKTAGYIVQSIRGVTTSMVIDLCYLLEGQRTWELPEVLLGAVRFSNLDMAATKPLDTSQEVPYWPEPWDSSNIFF